MSYNTRVSYHVILSGKLEGLCRMNKIHYLLITAVMLGIFLEITSLMTRFCNLKTNVFLKVGGRRLSLVSSQLVYAIFNLSCVLYHMYCSEMSSDVSATVSLHSTHWQVLNLLAASGIVFFL